MTRRKLLALASILPAGLLARLGLEAKPMPRWQISYLVLRPGGGISNGIVLLPIRLGRGEYAEEIAASTRGQAVQDFVRRNRVHLKTADMIFTYRAGGSWRTREVFTYMGGNTVA